MERGGSPRPVIVSPPYSGIEPTFDNQGSVAPNLLERLVATLSDRYRIERELGSGGMATVYLAQDVRHDRKVALKVLKPELAAVIGASRFLAEIKTTANLQNPHILSLHDSGEVDGTVFYVMPYIAGESLRGRLNREKQLPIPVAVRIATEVADALQYAHSHGVIHRDIKPENILLQDGHAVVADFGIALAASSAGSRMTETGMSLGTPHYMSPEQAMGERDLDARTDIYALGCVLYEMLTGQPPFTGPTAQSIVAKVITEAPIPPSKLRSTVDDQLDNAVLTALQKLPADRFDNAAEFASEMAGESMKPSRTRARGRQTARFDRWRFAAIAMGVAAAGLLILSSWALTRGAGDIAGPVSYDAALPDTALMSFSGATAQSAYGLNLTNLSISSEGSLAVYSALRGDSSSLWYRSLRDGSSGPIEGTTGGVVAKISPDGTRVAFMASNRVMIVPLRGGAARQLFVAGNPATVYWTSPTRLLVIHTDGTAVTWIDPDTGPIRNLTIPRCTLGTWIAEEEKFLCGSDGTAWVVDPATGSQRPLVSRGADGNPDSPIQGSDFRVVDGRYLVYLSSDGELRAAAFDAKKSVTSRGVSLIAGIRRESTGSGQFALSSSGTLVYVPGTNAEIGALVVLRSGREPEPLNLDAARFLRFDLSPNRRWLAAVVQAQRGQELRMYDLRDRQEYLWLRAPSIRHPIWNRDGRRLIVYISDSTHSAVILGVPGSIAPPDTLLAAKGMWAVPDPVDYYDDRTAVAVDIPGQTAVTFDPTANPVRLDTIGKDVVFPSLSPNGNRLSYQTRDGRVVVTAYPSGSERIQVSARGAEPIWLSATELIYRVGSSWYVARLDATTGEPGGTPVLWGKDPRFSDTSGWSNRPSRDGGIIYLQGPEKSTAGYLRVVPNWVSKMKAAVDSAARQK